MREIRYILGQRSVLSQTIFLLFMNRSAIYKRITRGSVNFRVVYIKKRKKQLYSPRIINHI